MELEILKHYINGTLIEEPIGFDGLKTKIKRGAYHGISAELSVGTLQFYNAAADIISAAYHAGIDTELTYRVVAEGDIEIYSGVIDLSTYSVTENDSRKISVKVGEIGVKTTFNNRSETEVDLNSTKTFSGLELAHKPTWRRLRIPEKSIVYTNQMKARGNVVWQQDTTPSGRFHLGDDYSHFWVNITTTGVNQLEEFGECTIMPDIADSIGGDYIGGKTIGDYYQPFFAKNASWNEKYGVGSKYSCHIKGTFKFEFLSSLFTNSPVSGIQEMTCCLALIKGDTTFGYVYADFHPIMQTSAVTLTNSNRSCSFTIDWELQNCEYQKLYLGLFMRNRNFYDVAGVYRVYNNQPECRATIYDGSFIEMRLTSQNKAKTIDADMLPVHEAANTIVEIISDNQLQVKSDWLGRPDSVVYPTQPPVGGGVAPCGGGAAKAITNGYKIRGLYSDADNQRNMPMSFKDYIEAMDALDCIGWGFVDEDGKTLLRIERWDWFYRPNVILRIDGVNETTRAIDPERVPTQLQIGYKKYTSNEDINAIDSIHSERTFTSGIKAVSKQISKLCKWIADNYSIEETRRKAIDTSTEEFKYDENIFVFELKCGYNGGYVSYSVATDSIEQASGFAYNAEIYNARISPRRMAERWRSFLASMCSSSAFNLTSGKVNYTASYKTKPSQFFSYGWQRYLDAPESGVLAENASIPNDTPKMHAETLKFKYPLTFAQYAAIKSDPYGIVVVDGVEGWIKEMTFDFSNGETEFTIIPKFE